jgi:hypothetical protein
VESIDFEESKWQVGAPVKYTVKLRAHDVFFTDTVLDPSDNYSFSESEDGSVSVTHKVSAKGIKSGDLSPFERARVFVDKYVGKDHFEATWLGNPYFIANRKPTLLSRSENVNRLEGSYSITENYKYYTDSSASCSQCEDNEWQNDALNFASEDVCRAYYGCSLTIPHLKTVKIDQNMSSAEDFNTVSYSVEYKGDLDDASSIANLRTIVNTETLATHRTYEKDIAKELLGDINNHGKVYQISISIQEDESANKLSVKGVYQTGEAGSITNPYFDFKIDFAKDEVTDISTYSINGDVKSFGNIETKKARLKAFKDTNYNNIENYLHTKVTNSEVFETFGNEPCADCDNGEWEDNSYASLAACRADKNCTDRIVNPYSKNLKWSENPSKATLNISAEFSDADYLDNLANGKYSVDITSTKSLYKELPSANVDGVYALQKLNCNSATTTKITVNGDTPHKGLYTDPFPGTNDESPDLVANLVLQGLQSEVANKSVPSDPDAYNAAPSIHGYAKEKVDESSDTQYPYTFSLSESYLHTPTLNNFQIIQGFPEGWAYMRQDQINYTRNPGYKFGY